MLGWSNDIVQPAKNVEERLMVTKERLMLTKKKKKKVNGYKKKMLMVWGKKGLSWSTVKMQFVMAHLDI